MHDAPTDTVMQPVLLAAIDLWAPLVLKTSLAGLWEA